MEREHKEERTKFNEYMDKIQRCFPHVEKLLLLHMEQNPQSTRQQTSNDKTQPI